MSAYLRLVLPADTAAPGRVRNAVSSAAIIPPHLRQDAALLVSELVTNAVEHGPPGDLEVTAESILDTTIRIEVGQSGGHFIMNDSGIENLPATAQGLRLIDRLADRWGVVPQAGDGVAVWIEIDV